MYASITKEEKAPTLKAKLLLPWMYGIQWHLTITWQRI